MDLNELKGKPLDDKTHAALVAYVDGLKTNVSDAEAKVRKANADHSAALKSVTGERDAAFDRLGVSTKDELEKLPDAKGQAEAAKQVEARMNKLTRELADKNKAHEELTVKYTAERQERALAAAVGKHSFVDAGDAAALLGRGVVAEGDEFLFKGADGKLIKLDDAAAWLAKSKPHLVKPSGSTTTPGSGFNNGTPPAAKTMTRAEFDALPHDQRAKSMREGVKLT